MWIQRRIGEQILHCAAGQRHAHVVDLAALVIDGRDIARRHRLIAVEAAAAGAGAARTGENSQEARGRAAGRRGVLVVGNLDGPGAVTDRQAGEGCGVLGFQMHCFRTHLSRGDMAGIGGERRHDANRRGEGGGGGSKRNPIRQRGHWRCFPHMPPAWRVTGAVSNLWGTYAGRIRPWLVWPWLEPPSPVSFWNASFVWFGAAAKAISDICLTISSPLIIGPRISHIVVRRRLPRRGF